MSFSAILLFPKLAASTYESGSHIVSALPRPGRRPRRSWPRSSAARARAAGGRHGPDGRARSSRSTSRKAWGWSAGSPPRRALLALADRRPRRAARLGLVAVRPVPAGPRDRQRHAARNRRRRSRARRPSRAPAAAAAPRPAARLRRSRPRRPAKPQQTLAPGRHLAIALIPPRARPRSTRRSSSSGTARARAGGDRQRRRTGHRRAARHRRRRRRSRRPRSRSSCPTSPARTSRRRSPPTRRTAGSRTTSSTRS